jgi:hypothetical protein
MGDDEDGAVKTLTFSDEILVPASMHLVAQPPSA